MTHRTEAHCGRHGCVCTHTGACFKGWMDRDDGPTAPCRMCRPELDERLANIPSPGFRSAADLTHLRSRRSTKWTEETP